MKKIEAIIRPGRLDAVKKRLDEIGTPGLTVSTVSGRGSERKHEEKWRGDEYIVDLYQKVKIESVVSDDRTEKVIEAIADVAHSGNPGDGKIFVIPVDDAYQIRTGIRGDDALHRDEPREEATEA